MQLEGTVGEACRHHWQVEARQCQEMWVHMKVTCQIDCGSPWGTGGMLLHIAGDQIDSDLMYSVEYDTDLHPHISAIGDIIVVFYKTEDVMWYR